MNRLEARREAGMVEPESWEGQWAQQAAVGTALRMLSLPVSVSGQAAERVSENTQDGE